MKKELNIVKINLTNNFNNDRIQEIEKVINCFENIDDESFKYRYPFSKDLDNYFNKKVIINLNDLKSKIDFFSSFVGEYLS